MFYLLSRTTFFIFFCISHFTFLCQLFGDPPASKGSIGVHGNLTETNFQPPGLSFPFNRISKRSKGNQSQWSFKVGHIYVNPLKNDHIFKMLHKFHLYLIVYAMLPCIWSHRLCLDFRDDFKDGCKVDGSGVICKTGCKGLLCAVEKLGCLTSWYSPSIMYALNLSLFAKKYFSIYLSLLQSKCFTFALSLSLSLSLSLPSTSS